MTSLPLSVAHSRHLQKANELLEGILSNPNEHQNRVDMRRIMDALSHTGISLGHFLGAFQQRESLAQGTVSAETSLATPVQTTKHQCPICEKSFQTSSALSGHGPARCAIKHGKELPS
ncbi:hypothetical protein DTQ70_03805 [Runella sp. SP2]|nr:hypothetical protein DTQ70_03805 [Runella sp. SP2]